MVDDRSVDEYLGFAVKTVTKPKPESGPAVDAPGDGAYEDSWYQVLKATVEEAEQG